MKKFKWDKKYLYWGITALLVILCSLAAFMTMNRLGAIRSLLGQIFGILQPVIYGLVIAYLLTPVVRFFEEKVYKGLERRIFPKNPRRAHVAVRILSMLTAFLLSLLLIAVLLTLLLPQLYDSVESLVSSLPGYVTETIQFLQESLENTPELEDVAVNVLGDVSDYFIQWVQNSLMTNIDTVLAGISSGVIGLIMVIYNFLVGLIFSIYIIYNRELFSAQIKKILYGLMNPKRVKSVLHGVGFVDRSFGGFLRGKILDSAIIGVLCFFLMLIFRIPYSPLISVIIGVTNIIPFFGPFIGAIPSAFLILMESPFQCLIFVIMIIILQQFDGNILGPKILSNTTGLNGFWVMFSIIVGGGLFGFWGMLLGVPVFSIIYAAIKYIITRLLNNRSMAVDTSAYMGDVQQGPPEAPEEEDSV